MRSAFALLVLAAFLGCGTANDSRQQALGLARDAIACTVSADCCAVVDGCRAQVLLVAAADRDQAAALLADAPQDLCVGCITPAVQVDCVAGSCVAAPLEPDGSGSGGDWPVAFSQDHCGALEVPAGWQVQTAAAPRGALAAQTVIGCGD